MKGYYLREREMVLYRASEQNERHQFLLYSKNLPKYNMLQELEIIFEPFKPATHAVY